MEEIWKDIKGFEGLYQVSDKGRIRSLLGDCCIMKTHKRNGLFILGLTKDKHQYCFSVCHLVAEAFVENPNNCKYILHKDGNKENDNAENLMWGCCNKKVYGVGINDVGYIFLKDGRMRPSYRAWSSMLQRIYQKSARIKHPTYQKCSVCDEWLFYSNFKKWFENPANGFKDGYKLDKDIIKKGNTVYCPEYCCIVPQRINCLFTKNDKCRGDLPIGVVRSWGRFYAQMGKDGVMIKLASYATPKEAFCRYKQSKEAYIKEIAEEYYKKGEITQRVYEAMLRYRVDITD